MMSDNSPIEELIELFGAAKSWFFIAFDVYRPLLASVAPTDQIKKVRYAMESHIVPQSIAVLPIKTLHLEVGLMHLPNISNRFKTSQKHKHMVEWILLYWVNIVKFRALRAETVILIPAQGPGCTSRDVPPPSFKYWAPRDAKDASNAERRRSWHSMTQWQKRGQIPVFLI